MIQLDGQSQYIYIFTQCPTRHSGSKNVQKTKQNLLKGVKLKHVIPPVTTLGKTHRRAHLGMTNHGLRLVILDL
jgi:hypothetical protein